MSRYALQFKGCVVVRYSSIRAARNSIWKHIHQVWLQDRSCDSPSGRLAHAQLLIKYRKINRDNAMKIIIEALNIKVGEAYQLSKCYTLVRTS